MLDHREKTRRHLCDALTDRIDEAVWSTWGSRDWDQLISVADREGVAPLLCRSLEDGGWLERVPEGSRRALQRAPFVTATNNLLILNELCRISDAFGGVMPEVHPVVLKGADLSLTVYQSLALRPMCDLDLLVRRKHLEEAVRQVRELGYREAFPEMASGHRGLTGHAVCLQGGLHDSVAVEIHWGLVAGAGDWRSPDLEWFWEQTEEWKPEISGEQTGAQTARIPSSFFHLKPLAHLLYLAAHLMFQHPGPGARLIWFYDLHLLVCRYEDWMDWGEILERAREFRWTAPLVAALEGTQAHFGTRLPDGFLEKLSAVGDHQGHKLMRQASAPLQSRGEGAWEELMCLSWRGRFKFAWNHFFPSATYMSWKYKPKPKWLWPLYYPYRWGVIFTEGLRAMRRRRRLGRLGLREENP